MKKKIIQTLLVCFLTLTAFASIYTCNEISVATGFSVNSMPSTFYTGYFGNRYTLSKADSAIAPHVMVGLTHTWKDVISPFTGSHNAQFSLGLTFYGAWSKQKFKMNLTDDSNGATNLFAKQDLIDTRLYLLGSYQLWQSNNASKDVFGGELFLTGGIGLAFNLLKNFTLYETGTNAAIGSRFEGTQQPVIFTPFIGLDWQYSFAHDWAMKISYAYTYACTRYKKEINIYQPDAAASHDYQIDYQRNISSLINLQLPPEFTVHSQIFALTLSKQF